MPDPVASNRKVTIRCGNTRALFGGKNCRFSAAVISLPMKSVSSLRFPTLGQELLTVDHGELEAPDVARQANHLRGAAAAAGLLAVP